MRVLYVIAQNSEMPPNKSRQLAERGVETIISTTAKISAFTAMKISKLLEKTPVDIIEVANIKDAMAALSAKKITKNCKAKVIVNIHANTLPPKSIPKEIKENVDGWIFKSNYTKSKYPEDIKNTVVISPASYTVYPEQYTKKETDVLNILWIGEISDTQRLKQAVDAIIPIEANYRFRICGAGRAATVMPVVRYTRHTPNSDKIEWAGENFDAVKEINNSDILISSNIETNEYESAALSSGRAVINADKIVEYINGNQSNTIIATDYCDIEHTKQLISFYNLTLKSK